MTEYPEDRLPVLIGEADIRRRVDEIGAEIRAFYGDETPLLVGILTGAVVFLADLARAIPGDVRFEFMAVSSYGDATTSSGAVRILKDLDSDIAGRRILLVEDIVDSGTTLNYLLRMLRDRDPEDVRVVSLLRKPEARQAGTNPDWIGFEIDEVFVVGYGLDVAGRFRNLPYIASLQAD
ncbi:MAG: hypoxanthine phosphoribosyltransferase [Thermomicrobiales bacterium]